MNKRMKTLGRLLAAVTSLAILLSMTAFAEGKESNPEPTATSSVEPTKAPTTSPDDEDIKDNNTPPDDEGIKAVTPHLMAYCCL